MCEARGPDPNAGKALNLHTPNRLNEGDGEEAFLFVGLPVWRSSDR